MRSATKRLACSAAAMTCMALPVSASAIVKEGIPPFESRMFRLVNPIVDRPQVAFLIPRPDDSKTPQNKSAKGATPATGLMDPINVHHPQVAQFAQIGTGDSPNQKSKTPSERGGSLIVNSDGRFQINPETPQEEPKEKSWFNTPGRVAGAAFVTSLLAIGLLIYIATGPFNPGRRLQLRAAKLRQEAEKQKGDSQ